MRRRRGWVPSEAPLSVDIAMRGWPSADCQPEVDVAVVRHTDRGVVVHHRGGAGHAADRPRETVVLGHDHRGLAALRGTAGCRRIALCRGTYDGAVGAHLDVAVEPAQSLIGEHRAPRRPNVCPPSRLIGDRRVGDAPATRSRPRADRSDRRAARGTARRPPSRDRRTTALPSPRSALKIVAVVVREVGGATAGVRPSSCVTNVRPGHPVGEQDRVARGARRCWR